MKACLSVKVVVAAFNKEKATTAFSLHHRQVKNGECNTKVTHNRMTSVLILGGDNLFESLLKIQQREGFYGLL